MANDSLLTITYTSLHQMSNISLIQAMNNSLIHMENTSLLHIENTSFLQSEVTEIGLHFVTNVTNVTNFTTTEYTLSPSFTDENVARVTANESSLELTRLIVQKICVPLVTLTGVIGNSLSIVVLTRKCMKSSTNSYLTALAMFDLLYLIFSFVLSLKHHSLFTYSVLYVHCFPIVRVLTDMFSNVSVILTVTFTVERYIGVCHPMKGRILCTSQRAKLITAVVSVIGIMCTLPEFWEMEVMYRSINNRTVPQAVYTEFAHQPSYEVGYSWFLVVTFTLLPLVLLCVFNGILISTVIRAAKLRKEMTLLTPVSSLSNTGRSGHNQPKEQLKITKMLITVVLAFIMCQLPGALLLLVQTYHSLAEVHVSREKQNNFKIAGNVTNLLFQLNASINFILYSAISTKFRCVFFRIVCKRRNCLALTQDRRRTTFSRSDGVQMSSYYGDKLGSKTTCSTYTCKVKVSHRSPKSEATQMSDTVFRKQWGRHIGPNAIQTTNQNEGIQDVCQESVRLASWLSTGTKQDEARSRNCRDTSGRNDVYVEGDNLCLADGCGNNGNGLRINWRGNNGPNLLWTSDNVNR